MGEEFWYYPGCGLMNCDFCYDTDCPGPEPEVDIYGEVVRGGCTHSCHFSYADMLLERDCANESKERDSKLEEK